MTFFVKWSIPLLLVVVLIHPVFTCYAADNAQQPSPSPCGESDSLPSLLQDFAPAAGPEPIILASVRNVPDGTPKPKRKPKTKGPIAGKGCGTDGYLLAGDGTETEIKTPCKVAAGTYNYGFVYIHSGGSLTFEEATIDFWAKSILVENEGSLIVGSFLDPIGKKNLDNVVTFHLYGDDSQTAGITCKTHNCGVADTDWKVGGTDRPIKLPSSAEDLFYSYQRLPADNYDWEGGKALTKDSYFGLKVLAVSYGGTLQMFGKKGAEYQEPALHGDSRSLKSGESWVRLNQSVCPPDSLNTGCVSPDKTGTKLVLDRIVETWERDDWIVVTATDYLPNHSEMRQIANVQTDGDRSVITLKTALSYPHNGQKYDLSRHKVPERLNDYGEDFMKSVDTRAAVALLTRSIRIISEGAAFKEPLPPASATGTGKYFGGHVIARQGFKNFQMKGVELKQLGQGGRMAHSPVNFHMARKLPAEGKPNSAFVVSCSVNESMTRMYEIRGTQGVILKRNVGYKSIGHGYYLAEGTETENHLEANLGIYARPAVDYRDNPRKVPGILASPSPLTGSTMGSYATDYIHPSVFYFANGYNSFEDNMAVGAGTCGACYWIAPVSISGFSQKQTWDSYAWVQHMAGGTAPIYRFHGNFCSTAQHSLITIDSTGVCNGVQHPWIGGNDPFALKPIYTPFDGGYKENPDTTVAVPHSLYPDIPGTGAFLQPTICRDDMCREVESPCAKGQTANCAVNVIDSYTSSFHWAQQNYSAIWLREKWFLFTNGALSDVLNGGLTMVSGGSWDQVVNKYWAVTRKSVFIGNTQEDKENVYAQNRGPVNPDTKGKLKCLSGKDVPASYCRVQDQDGKDEGIVIPSDDFSVYQRLYNIYDGPVYQEANAYVNIKEREVFGCDNNTGTCGQDTNFLYWQTHGISKAKEGPLKGKCILPNAAIGWKQPNGFYYPPAFHSKNLFFDNVDLRHFVIVPLFVPGTFDVDNATLKKDYCTYAPGNPKSLFTSQFTDIDRQTELNDDDGSLSGLSGAVPQQVSDTNGTVSVNKDQFYYAPKTPFECLSEQSCYQSPYDYVSAVVFPDCAAKNPTGDCTHFAGSWSLKANSALVYGVPIYRQYLNAGETAGVAQGIKMMGAEIYQRSAMIANHGLYYIDTAMGKARQQSMGRTNVNSFLENEKYNFFLIYAKPKTRVTFQLYVGKTSDVKFDELTAVEMVRVGTNRRVQETNPALDDVTVLVSYKNLEFSPQKHWPDKWIRTYYPATGILEVTMDLADYAHEFQEGRKEACGPESFCHWNTAAGECRCAPHDDRNNPNPIGYSCDNSSNVCAWSSYRSECPSGGCFGFQVTFPDGFVADDDNSSEYAAPIHRPQPTAFPSIDDWHVGWQKAAYPLAFDASAPWDHEHYPAPGPCDYNNDSTYPRNAPLPSSVHAESMDE